MNETHQTIYIRALELQDVEPLLALRQRNRDFLQPFEPTHQDVHFTKEGLLETFQKSIADREAGKGYGFGVFIQETDELIGRVNLSNIVRGAWQNCTIGYFLDEKQNGKGYMTEAVRLAVRFAFTELDLHRVQAAVMPRNIGSIRVVEKAGFRYEGMSPRYLRINGQWEDHNIYAITKEDLQSE